LLKLAAPLEPRKFRELRRQMALRHHKWDAQVGDELALSDAPLLMSRSAWADLARLATELFAETHAVEDELLERPELHGSLGLPRALRQVLREGVSTPAAARIKRFDFHWTTEGWRLSEVNADVPWQRGGLELWRLVDGTSIPAAPYLFRRLAWYDRLAEWLRPRPQRRSDGAYGDFWHPPQSA
jgi:hypothetical protein